ncbi:MAG: potassium channel family protein [Bacillota bacterium]
MGPVRKILFATLSVLLVAIVGIWGFMTIEGYSLLDAISVTIAIITTTNTGFGSISPHTVLGRIFTIFLVVVGFSMVAYAFGTIMGTVLEGHLKNFMGRTKMLKKISALKDHIIICGAGRVGHHVILRLQKEKVPFVVIDKNEETAARLLEDGLLTINDDATKDEVLHLAGIDRARGLISALPGDAENVFVTLTAKELNPRLMVVARSDLAESKTKLIRAGADKVISPSVMGGRRMAISILKPVSVDFVETLIHRQDVEIEIEEIIINASSPLAGQKLRDSQIKQKTGTMVVAIKRGDEIISNPSADDIILGNDLLIVLGTREQLASLELLAGGGA